MQRAASELLRRRKAQQELTPFIEFTTPRWSPSNIHRRIAHELERVERGEIDRLMILCPPQHGKSRIASERYPAFSLGRDPMHDIISASATQALATKFGREVRNCVAGADYQRLFPDVLLAEDTQAKGEWRTAQGGSYYAVGVGGAVMGRGCSRLVIDDPFATWADAQSELTRDNVWDWYRGTLYNRVRPGGAIVLIQHRMAEDDLAGRLLEQQKAGHDKWTVVELRADDEPLPWPERYDKAALERIRANTDARQWSALYLQNPVPEEGVFFKRDTLKFYDPRKVPAGHKYMSGDFAVTEGGGDFTEIATHVYTGDLYLGVDSWYGQRTADVWIEQLIDQVKRHKPFSFIGEGGPIRRAVEPFLTRRMRERNAWVTCEWIPRSADKPTMARSLQAMAGLGKVYLPDNEYGQRLMTQMLAFPGGQRDDAVDMAVNMACAIDLAVPSILRAPEKKPEVDRWERIFNQDSEDADSWKTA